MTALFWSWPLLGSAPRGDGHPVLVIPGFLATGSSTWALRRFCSSLGYRGHRWKLGRNLGPVGNKVHEVRVRLEELADRYGQKVSLVGWSLGGIYARELAWLATASVRQVITLGTPFAATNSSTVGALYEDISGQEIRSIDPALLARIPEPPPVPSTSIYSRTDGVVSWRASLERRSPTTENIRVAGSHLGLGFNPSVLWAIADRLAQPEDGWRPFVRTGCRRFLYPPARWRDEVAGTNGAGGES